MSESYHASPERPVVIAESRTTCLGVRITVGRQIWSLKWFSPWNIYVLTLTLRRCGGSYCFRRCRPRASTLRPDPSESATEASSNTSLNHLKTSGMCGSSYNCCFQQSDSSSQAGLEPGDWVPRSYFHDQASIDAYFCIETSSDFLDPIRGNAV